jgi:hypothetical protein
VRPRAAAPPPTAPPPPPTSPAPPHARRRTQRAKEVARNKKERHLHRDALAQTSEPEKIREQLREVIAQEEEGAANPTLRLRKKALQQALGQAVREQMEAEAAAKRGAAEAAAGPSSAAGPSGGGFDLSAVPLPLEGGGASGIPLPPMDIPMPSRPPPGPLPGAPPGAPPGYGDARPPFAPPGAIARGPALHAPPRLAPPPPGGPPPPPGGGEPAAPQQVAPAPAPGKVIAKESTVAALPRAQTDARLTSMVPASLRRAKPPAPPRRPPAAGPGFGLVPAPAPVLAAPAQAAAAQAPVDDKYAAFMAELGELGAL